MIACAWAGALRADVDDSAYDVASKRVSAAARRAMDAQLAREKEEEIARERVASEAAARAEAERLAALAARPWPERATELNCTGCHPASHYTSKTHALPGWWAVALRMKYMNNAPISWDDMPLVVDHLHARYPARGLDRAGEWLLLLALLASPLALRAISWLTRRAIHQWKR